jgi:hypothetical protein
MFYEDGRTVRVGDRLKTSDGIYGVVVCSLDTEEYSERFPASEWSYLGKGILLESPEVGIVHYPDPPPGLERQP